jgi:hypothetical protein
MIVKYYLLACTLGYGFSGWKEGACSYVVSSFNKNVNIEKNIMADIRVPISYFKIRNGSGRYLESDKLHEGAK